MWSRWAIGAGGWLPLAGAPTGSAAAASSVYRARASTIATAETPQVVRDGVRLYQVNPANPAVALVGGYRFTGVDAYELNTWWGVNGGCGSMESTAQLASLFSTLGGPDETSARNALRSFYDTIRLEIRASDPNHLNSDGAPPIGGCSTLDYAGQMAIE